MKFKTFSRELIELWIPKENCAIISISDPGSEPVILNVNKLVKGVLRLSFHDIDNFPAEILPLFEKEGIVLFSYKHADKIVKFICNNLNEISLIACNCEAGISRSRGVIAALSKAIIGNDDKVFQRGRPNLRIRSILLERWHKMREPI